MSQEIGYNMTAHIDDKYVGSQIFSSLAEYIGVTTVQFNFAITQVVALGLSTLYRTVFHPSKATTTERHVFGLVVSITMGYFCFGFLAIHLAALPMVCYIVIITQNPNKVHVIMLAVAFIHLSFIHLHRQIYDYDTSGVDISGPLMIITQKVTSLAFNLHDGFREKNKEKPESHKNYAVFKIPSLLDYFSYTLLFPTLLAGPMIFYKDYSEFIEGRNYQKLQNNSSSKKVTVPEPSLLQSVTKKIILASFCAVIFLNFSKRFPISRLKDDDFIENTGISYTFYYLLISTTSERFKYYFAWILADAICHNSGLGFLKYNKDGSTNWSTISNIDIYGFEFATSVKESIEAWNKSTSKWLRFTVYERIKIYPTLLTYAVSAVWHGFYAGYYFTLLGTALFTLASRTMRRHIRNYFLGNEKLELLYNALAFIATRLVMAYISFPFVLLEFWPSFRVYNKMYWCLHICAVLTLILVPFVSKLNQIQTKRSVIPSDGSRPQSVSKDHNN